MSESISNIRIIPPTHPIKPVVESDKDRKPGKQDDSRDKKEEGDGDSKRRNDSDDQDQPLLDEYV